MSEDTLLPFDLPSVAHKKVSVGFDGGQLSSDAGVLVLRGVEKKLGLAARHRRCAMAVNERRILRCAIYTRKSSEHGLEQDFNSLDAQREAAEVFIKSQAHEGWRLVKARYDDGGISGGTLERPALQSLLDDIRSRKVDVVVVYKVDRLTRSLADFAKLVELFDQHSVSFVSVTQSFNTTTSMGRLTLNVLLSFAQFERELAGERIRDKFAASRRKGMLIMSRRRRPSLSRRRPRSLGSGRPSLRSASVWCSNCSTGPI